MSVPHAGDCPEVMPGMTTDLLQAADALHHDEAGHVLASLIGIDIAKASNATRRAWRCITSPPVTWPRR